MLLSLLPTKAANSYVMSNSNQALLNYGTNITTNHWCSIDAHSPNGAMTVLLSVSPITDANPLVMPNSNQSIV
jgi:hypothetical protein